MCSATRPTCPAGGRRCISRRGSSRMAMRPGSARVIDLWTKGWLPYTLRWRFRVTESDPPRTFSLEAAGDFVGEASGRSRRRIRRAVVTRSRASSTTGGSARRSGLLKLLSPVMRPFFAANHRWAMAQGERSLRLELARRRAAGDRTMLDALPQPPGPTFDLSTPASSASVTRPGRDRPIALRPAGSAVPGQECHHVIEPEATVAPLADAVERKLSPVTEALHRVDMEVQHLCDLARGEHRAELMDSRGRHRGVVPHRYVVLAGRLLGVPRRARRTPQADLARWALRLGPM